MALTITNDLKDGKAASAPGFRGKVHVACDASYPTGGYAFDPATELEIGGMTVFTMYADPGSKQGAFYEHEVQWDAENSKLKIVKNNAGTLEEEAAETDLSTFEFDLIIFGY